MRAEWSGEMELGVPAMDRSHQEFVMALNDVAAAPDSEFPVRMSKLVAQVELDFAAEERLMEEICYSGLRTHREHHARVLSGLHHTISRVMDGDVGAGRIALDTLFDWFLVHLSTMDLALAVAMEMAESGRRLPVVLTLENDMERMWNNIGK